jgi:GAF domain-containing protein
MTRNTSPYPLDSAVAELQELLLSTASVEQFLDDLSVVAADTMGDGTSCGITMARDGRPHTVASSDERATHLDEVQYGKDDGPCLHSMRTGEVVSIEDMASEGRWAEYQASAIAHGTRSSLSMPIRSSGMRGALNLYAAQPHHFGAEQLALAHQLSQEAARAVALAVRLAEHTELNRNLGVALASRSVIDQAIGVVMNQNRCTADDAFEILRTASNHRNVKLRTIAADIVAAVADHAERRSDSTE